MWFEGWDEELLGIGKKALAKEALDVGLAVEQTSRVDAVIAQAGQEGRGLPMTVRDFGHRSLAARRPAAEARHVGLGPRSRQ